MSNRIVNGLMVLALSVPTLASAQWESMALQDRGKGTWEFNAGGGLKIMDGKLQSFLISGPAANRFSSNLDQQRMMPGVNGRVEYNFARRFSFGVGGEAAWGSGITYLTPLTALTFTPRPNARTMPFISLGTQVTRIIGTNDRRVHPTWGAHLGLGIKQMFTHNLAMRIDGKVATEHYQALPEHKAAYPSNLSIGLSYFTGGPKRVEYVTMPGGEVVRWRSDTVNMTHYQVDTVDVYTKGISADQLILRVQFRTDATELLEISRPVLDTIAMAIIETPGSRWEVQGHTDNVGSPSDNKLLSQGRAQTVVDYLVSRGVPRSDLMATGYGEARPVFSNATAYGRAQNRRVQLRRIPPPPRGVPVP